MQLWGVCSSDVISSSEPSELCADGGVLEYQALMDHHTSYGFSWSIGQPTSRHSRSRDRPTYHNSRSSSQCARRSENRPTIEDSRSMDRPTLQLTMSWTDNQSGRVP
jgi:hypothetical protein